VTSLLRGGKGGAGEGWSSWDLVDEIKGVIINKAICHWRKRGWALPSCTH